MAAQTWRPPPIPATQCLRALDRNTGRKVPEGRHTVAHRFNGGRGNVSMQSPVGATQMVEHLCRPYGAEFLPRETTHHLRGGLRWFVPTGLHLRRYLHCGARTVT